MSFERNDIKGTIRGANLAILRARESLLTGIEDQDCILTPNDMLEANKAFRDMGTTLKEIKLLLSKFNSVADARKAIHV